MTDTSDKQINYNDNLNESDLNLITIFATTLILYSNPTIYFFQEYELQIEKGLLHDVGRIDITIQKYSISYFFVVMSQILDRQKKLRQK